MKKLIILAAALLFSTSAFAKKEQNVNFDMNELLCKDLLSKDIDEESASYMLMWIDGYLSGVTGDTTFDGNQFNSFAEALGTECAKSPDSKVLDVSKNVGIEK